jgi:hypothetical protein
MSVRHDGRDKIVMMRRSARARLSGFLATLDRFHARADAVVVRVAGQAVDKII